MFLAESPRQVSANLKKSREQFQEDRGTVSMRTIFCSRFPLTHHSGEVSSLKDNRTGNVAMATVPVDKKKKKIENSFSGTFNLTCKVSIPPPLWRLAPEDTRVSTWDADLLMTDVS